MYILQKDLHKDTTDIIPYGFEVDIIKDCSSLRHDIADVFNVIDRQGPRYVQTIEKVCFKINQKPPFDHRKTYLFCLFFYFIYFVNHRSSNESTVFANRNGAFEQPRL